MSVNKKKRKRKYKQSVPAGTGRKESAVVKTAAIEDTLDIVPKESNGQKKKTILLLPLFFCISVFYMEVVFKLAIETIHDSRSFLFLGLFSLCIGLIISGVIRLMPGMVAKVLAPLCLIFGFFVFMMEFLICRQFKVAYDVNTILNGATGELKGFDADIRRMIFCVDGICHIILFLLPVIAWFLLRKKIAGAFSERGIFGKGAGETAVTSLIYFAAGAAAYGIALFFILVCGWNKGVYTNQYNFESAVAGFGLEEGFFLDIRNMAAAKTDAPVFENVGNDLTVMSPQVLASSYSAMPSQVAAVEEGGPLPTALWGEEAGPTAGVAAALSGDERLEAHSIAEDDLQNNGEDALPDEPEPVVYGYNISDIDFDALAAEGGRCASVDAYVASVTPSMENPYTGMFEGKNLILICAEAFTGTIIDPELTPTLYRLSTKGINFNNYYQQSLAGTTGGEYQLLFGLIPTSGGSSVRLITENGTHTNMGAMLNEEGYYGMAFHNSSYTYYGRNETHTRMGYSEGFMGMGNGLESLISRRWPESDLEMLQATLPMYLDHQPFNVYYMTVSGHSGYLFSNNAMSKENRDRIEAWCEENELTYSEPVRAYIAANLELEKALAYLVETLEEEGIADDTVICIAPDHFPYGLDSNASLGNMPYLSELYGYEVNTYEERDRNRAIIWCGSLEEEEPIIVDSPTSSIDILPTLCNLFDVDWDSRLYPGRDVLSDAFPLAFFGNYDWKTDLGYYNSSRGVFTPVDETIEIPEGYVSQVSAIVRNKMTFCRSVLDQDYYTHVYGAVVPAAASSAPEEPLPEDSGEESSEIMDGQ